MPRRQPRRPNPATTSPRVYTSASPRFAQVNAARAIRLLRFIHASQTPHNAAHYVDDWHKLLIARDAANLADLETRIQTHNHDVAGIASMTDLAARDRIGTGILQFDAADMMRRIEAAGAKHAKGKTRGRAKNANRHLAYHCPICSKRVEKPDGTVSWTNTIRASASDRIIMCAGRHGAQHTPTLCEFDMSSQPDYRLADHAAAAGYVEPNQLADNASGNHDRSTARLTAEKARYASELASMGGHTTIAIGPTDPTSEFGF